MEVAKLAALNKELTGRNQDEELQRLQVLLNIDEDASVVLTRISPLSAGPGAVSIGGGLYKVRKPADMREQSVDVGSDDNKLGSLRSINAKLAEQLRQKSQEIEALEKQRTLEQENTEKVKADLESRIQHLQEEIAEHKNDIRSLEAERMNLNNQAGIVKESLQRHQANYEEFQKRIQFLEQELALRSKSEQTSLNTKNPIDVAGYEQSIRGKEEQIERLQAKIAELTAKQPTMEREMESLKRRIEELLLQREESHQAHDTEDLASQLEDAQTTVNVRF